jgi:hypothetical protein
MFRLPVLVCLTCAIAGASPLAWNWDIFHPANSLVSPTPYSTTPDAINSLANSYPTSVGDVANWLPATVALSESSSKTSSDDETGIGENETVPNSVIELDLSSLFGRPQIVGRHRVFGSIQLAVAPPPSV